MSEDLLTSSFRAAAEGQFEAAFEKERAAGNLPNDLEWERIIYDVCRQFYMDGFCSGGVFGAKAAGDAMQDVLRNHFGGDSSE